MSENAKKRGLVGIENYDNLEANNMTKDGLRRKACIKPVFSVIPYVLGIIGREGMVIISERAGYSLNYIRNLLSRCLGRLKPPQKHLELGLALLFRDLFTHITGSKIIGQTGTCLLDGFDFTPYYRYIASNSAHTCFKLLKKAEEVAADGDTGADVLRKARILYNNSSEDKINSGTLSNWISGEIETLTPKNWERMESAMLLYEAEYILALDPFYVAPSSPVEEAGQERSEVIDPVEKESSSRTRRDTRLRKDLSLEIQTLNFNIRTRYLSLAEDDGLGYLSGVTHELVDSVMLNIVKARIGASTDPNPVVCNPEEEHSQVATEV